MHPTTLSKIVAEAQSRDRIAAAADAIAAASVRPAAAPSRAGAPVAIRRARPEDAGTLERLAALDGRGDAFARVAASWAGDPELTVLLAEADGAPAAAVVVSTGTTLADPFARSGELVRLLKLRADQLRAPRGRLPARAAQRLHALRA